MKPDTEKVLSIIAAHGANAANLIAILQDVQTEYNYLSEANLTLIAETLNISVSHMYSVATFYENFSLEAKGKHIIKVCAGTACQKASKTSVFGAFSLQKCRKWCEPKCGSIADPHLDPHAEMCG